MKNALLVLIVLLSLSACGKKKMEPLAYNDSLAIEQIRIIEKANELQDAFAGYVEAEMEIRQKDLEAQLDKSQRTLDRVGSHGDDTRLLEASRKFIDGYRKLNREEYSEAIRLLSKPDTAYSEREEARLSILYKAIDAKAKQLGDDFIAAQVLFASEYALKLDQTKAEE